MSTKDSRAEDVVVDPFDPDQPIGDRPLTAEEKGNAASYGLSERDARKFSSRQLEEMAAEWVILQQDEVHLGC